MPLLDEFGHEIRSPQRRRLPKPSSPKPKNKLSAKRVSQSAPPIRNHARVELVLTAKHSLNGQTYGPGPVTVTLDVAAVLREGERRAAAADASFAGTKACVIGPGARPGALGVRQVAPEYFDLAQVNAVPFGVVDKMGQFAAN